MGAMLKLFPKRIYVYLSKMLQSRTAVAGAIIVMTCTVVFSCASAPEYPVFPPPISKNVSAGLLDTFLAASDVMKADPRLDLHTLDKSGRLIAFEKTSGFIFFRHRTIIDINLESIGPEETKIMMHLSAENYETGGLSRPADWYPSAEVDTFLGEDILNLIEKELAKRKG